MVGKDHGNKLAAPSSTIKQVQARDRLCHGKHTRAHMFVHYPPRTSTSSCQFQTTVRAAPRDMEVSLSSSFCYHCPVHCQAMSWLTSVRHRTQHPAKVRPCTVVSQLPYVTKIWGTEISLSGLGVFFSNPATHIFQDLLDTRLTALSIHCFSSPLQVPKPHNTVLDEGLIFSPF